MVVFLSLFDSCHDNLVTFSSYIHSQHDHLPIFFFILSNICSWSDAVKQCKSQSPIQSKCGSHLVCSCTLSLFSYYVSFSWCYFINIPPSIAALEFQPYCIPVLEDFGHLSSTQLVTKGSEQNACCTAINNVGMPVMNIGGRWHEWWICWQLSYALTRFVSQVCYRYHQRL